MLSLWQASPNLITHAARVSGAAVVSKPHDSEGTIVARTDLPSPSDGAAERQALAATGDREVLRQRLERLPVGHPSSPAADDSAERSPEPAKHAAQHNEAPKVTSTDHTVGHRDSSDASHAEDAHSPGESSEASPAQDSDKPPLTDAEHGERVQTIREWLDWGRQTELATDKQHLDDKGIWSQDRQDAHDAVVNDLYKAAASVPCERQAIMAGGLGGAGKSTVLDGYANVDRSKYLTINPDDIKEEMAKGGLIPQLDGLSPMEASDLVHEESSYVAKMLARRAMADGKNIIWDITMSSPDSVLSRLDALDAKGYSTKGIFVDITIDEAVKRADARHRRGHEQYRAGIGYGGRYVPPEVIKAQADEDWGSVNRRTFEQVKSRFSEWTVYDNNGPAPQLVKATEVGKLEEER